MQLLDKERQTYQNGELYHYLILPSEAVATKLHNLFFVPCFSFEWRRNACSPEYLPEAVRVDVGLFPVYGREVRQALLAAHNPWQDGRSYLLHALCAPDRLDYLNPVAVLSREMECRVNAAASVVIPFLATVCGESP